MLSMLQSISRVAAAGHTRQFFQALLKHQFGASFLSASWRSTNGCEVRNHIFCRGQDELPIQTPHFEGQTVPSKLQFFAFFDLSNMEN